MFFQEEYFYALAVNIYNIRIQHGIETRQEQDRDQYLLGHYRQKFEIQEILIYFYFFYFLN